MASGSTHRIAAGAVGVAVAVYAQQKGNRDLPHPLVAGGLAALLTNLPDLIEPATNPHHRQFFHSVLFASLLVAGLKRAYDWKPEDDMQKTLRGVLLLAGGAYLVHLALDACTARSLPWIGR